MRTQRAHKPREHARCWPLLPPLLLPPLPSLPSLPSLPPLPPLPPVPPVPPAPPPPPPPPPIVPLQSTLLATPSLAVVAVLFIKDLVGIGFERSQPLKEVLESFDAIRRVVRVPRSTKLNVAMDHCKRTRQHLLLVCDDDDSTAAAIAEAESKPAVKASPRGLEMPPPVRANAPVMGVASMEDFIEELIQDEIVDETDAWHYDRQEGEKPSAALIETSTKKGAGEQSMKKQPSQVKKVAVKAEGGVDLTAHLRKLAPAPAAASSQGAEWTLAAPPAQMEA